MQHRQIAAEYKELRLLGRGAFAEVLLAKHGPTGQLYVLKRLGFKGSSPEDDRDMRSTAMREVELLCALRHPHITLYRESFLDQNGERLNIVLEFCEKGTLAGYIASCKELPARRSVPEDRVWTWATQLLFAIQYCHSQNILHRDIKPANIFLTNKDQVKLGDFGIAKNILGASATRTRGIAGTPFYLAPEICEDERHSAKSDMWALGVSLYELCCLRLPFHGSNILAVVRAITCNDPPPLGAPYSSKLSQMVLSMLEKTTAQRPTADDVIAAYLRREVVERMEREVAKHESLVPAGIPLQAPKPRRRGRGSSPSPPPGVRPPVDEDALTTQSDAASQAGVLDSHHPLISPKPGLSPSPSLHLLPGAIAPEQTVGAAALDSIRFLPFTATGASTGEGPFAPLRSPSDSGGPPDIPFLGLALEVQSPSEHGSPLAQSMRSNNDLTVVSVNSSMVSLEGYVDLQTPNRPAHPPAHHHHHHHHHHPPGLPNGTPGTPNEPPRRPSHPPMRSPAVVARNPSPAPIARLPSAPSSPPKDVPHLKPPGPLRPHQPQGPSASTSASVSSTAPPAKADLANAVGFCCFVPDSDSSCTPAAQPSPRGGIGSRSASSAGDFDQQALLSHPTPGQDGSTTAPQRALEVDPLEATQLSLAGGSRPGETLPWDGEEPHETKTAWGSPAHTMVIRPADLDPATTAASKRTGTWAFTTGQVEVVRGCRCVIL